MTSKDLYLSILVGVGAAGGACVRYGLGLLWPGLWGLVIANAFACWAMGRFRPGLVWGTGFLGGLSSYSSYAIALGDDSLSPTLPRILLAIACAVGFWLLYEFGARHVASSRGASSASQHRAVKGEGR